MILVSGIKVHVLPFIGEGCAGECDPASTVIVRHCSLLPFGTPTGFHSLRDHSKIGDGTIAQAQSQQRRSPQKGKAAVLKGITVEITDTDARCTRTHEAIQRLVEKSRCRGK